MFLQSTATPETKKKFYNNDTCDQIQKYFTAATYVSSKIRIRFENIFFAAYTLYRIVLRS